MAKNPPPPKPTAAELDLLRVLWPLGSATVKEVHELAQKDKAHMSYATVLRLMQVMHGKGLLRRDESQRSHIYAPAQARESLRGNLLKELINKAYAGSGKELVMAALRGHVSAAERAEIQAFLEENE
jgi:predicted transcriptional regulator